MKVLVIPDVHLKYWMFEDAATLMRAGAADRAVCLMDLPDDWNAAYDRALYVETYDAAVKFQSEFPETLWCYGNHDMSYPWELKESGYSVHVADIVKMKMAELEACIPERQIAYIHRVDNVFFLHGGLTDYFISKYIPEHERDNVNSVIQAVNSFGRDEMWEDPSMTEFSPIWHRPVNYPDDKMYKADSLLQVVGHTPVNQITRVKNTITCDVFSTYRNGIPIGTQVFPVIDTESFEFCGVKASQYK